jgi:hypothetical protein
MFISTARLPAPNRLLCLEPTMPLKAGDLAPDCTFLRADGSEVRLSAWAGRPVILIFLRHVA